MSNPPNFFDPGVLQSPNAIVPLEAYDQMSGTSDFSNPECGSFGIKYSNPENSHYHSTPDDYSNQDQDYGIWNPNSYSNQDTDHQHQNYSNQDQDYGIWDPSNYSNPTPRSTVVQNSVKYEEIGPRKSKWSKMDKNEQQRRRRPARNTATVTKPATKPNNRNYTKYAPKPVTTTVFRRPLTETESSSSEDERPTRPQNVKAINMTSSKSVNPSEQFEEEFTELHMTSFEVEMEPSNLDPTSSGIQNLRIASPIKSDDDISSDEEYRNKNLQFKDDITEIRMTPFQIEMERIDQYPTFSGTQNSRIASPIKNDDDISSEDDDVERPRPSTNKILPDDFFGNLQMLDQISSESGVGSTVPSTVDGSVSGRGASFDEELDPEEMWRFLPKKAPRCSHLIGKKSNLQKEINALTNQEHKIYMTALRNLIAHHELSTIYPPFNYFRPKEPLLSRPRPLLEGYSHEQACRFLAMVEVWKTRKYSNLEELEKGTDDISTVTQVAGHYAIYRIYAANSAYYSLEACHENLMEEVRYLQITRLSKICGWKRNCSAMGKLVVGDLVVVKEILAEERRSGLGQKSLNPDIGSSQDSLNQDEGSLDQDIGSDQKSLNLDQSSLTPFSKFFGTVLRFQVLERKLAVETEFMVLPNGKAAVLGYGEPMDIAILCAINRVYTGDVLFPVYWPRQKCLGIFEDVRIEKDIACPPKLPMIFNVKPCGHSSMLLDDYTNCDEDEDYKDDLIDFCGAMGSAVLHTLRNNRLDSTVYAIQNFEKRGNTVVFDILGAVPWRLWPRNTRINIGNGVNATVIDVNVPRVMARLAYGSWKTSSTVGIVFQHFWGSLKPLERGFYSKMEDGSNGKKIIRAIFTGEMVERNKDGGTVSRDTVVYCAEPTVMQGIVIQGAVAEGTVHPEIASSTIKSTVTQNPGSKSTVTGSTVTQEFGPKDTVTGSAGSKSTVIQKSRSQGTVHPTIASSIAKTTVIQESGSGKSAPVVQNADFRGTVSPLIVTTESGSKSTVTRSTVSQQFDPKATVIQDTVTQGSRFESTSTIASPIIETTVPNDTVTLESESKTTVTQSTVPPPPTVHLNEFQLKYMYSILNNSPLTVAHFPYGSGKTTTVVETAYRSALKDYKLQNLIITLNHRSVFSLVDLLKRIPDVCDGKIRVVRCISEENRNEIPFELRTEFDFPVLLEKYLMDVVEGNIMIPEIQGPSNFQLAAASYLFHYKGYRPADSAPEVQHLLEMNLYPEPEKTSYYIKKFMDYFQPNILISTMDSSFGLLPYLGVTLGTVTQDTVTHEDPPTTVLQDRATVPRKIRPTVIRNTVPEGTGRLKTIQFHEGFDIPQAYLVFFASLFPQACFGLMGDPARPRQDSLDLGRNEKLTSLVFGRDQALVEPIISNIVYRGPIVDIMSSLYYGGKLLEPSRRDSLPEDIWTSGQPITFWPSHCLDLVLKKLSEKFEKSQIGLIFNDHSEGLKSMYAEFDCGADFQGTNARDYIVVDWRGAGQPKRKLFYTLASAKKGIVFVGPMEMIRNRSEIRKIQRIWREKWWNQNSNSSDINAKVQ